jgi:hypothetical protein
MELIQTVNRQELTELIQTVNRQELTELVQTVNTRAPMELVQMARRREPMEPHTVETQVDRQSGVREEAQRELAGDMR